MAILENLTNDVIVEEDKSAKMLGTIIVPKNLKVLEERLPKANYKSSTKELASVDSGENEEKKGGKKRRSSAKELVALRCNKETEEASRFP